MSDDANGIPLTDERDRALLLAAVDLIGRTGSIDFEVGYTDDDPALATWWAAARYRGARIMVEHHPGPVQAATALALRLMSGATCRCGRLVRIAGQRGPKGGRSCRYSLTQRPGVLGGLRWVPGCKVAPIPITEATRGDVAAMRAALDERLAGGS